MSETDKIAQKIKVSGKGESKTAAFASALNGVSKKVLKESSDVLLRIEPMNVSVCSAVENSYTERFLFFFFPRKKTTFEVELEVDVEISLINMETIKFQKVESEDPNGIPIPFLSKKL